MWEERGEHTTYFLCHPISSLASYVMVSVLFYIAPELLVIGIMKDILMVSRTNTNPMILGNGMLKVASSIFPPVTDLSFLPMRLFMTVQSANLLG